MYFPVNDILNNTIFGISKDFSEDMDTVIDQMLSKQDEKSESEA